MCVRCVLVCVATWESGAMHTSFVAFLFWCKNRQRWWIRRRRWRRRPVLSVETAQREGERGRTKVCVEWLWCRLLHICDAQMSDNNRIISRRESHSKAYHNARLCYIDAHFPYIINMLYYILLYHIALTDIMYLSLLDQILHMVTFQHVAESRLNIFIVMHTRVMNNNANLCKSSKQRPF